MTGIVADDKEQTDEDAIEYSHPEVEEWHVRPQHEGEGRTVEQHIDNKDDDRPRIRTLTPVLRHHAANLAGAAMLVDLDVFHCWLRASLPVDAAG